MTKGPWHTNTGFQDRIVLGLSLFSRCVYYLQPSENSSAFDGSQMVLDCDHHGYRDSGSIRQYVWIAKLPVQKWYMYIVSDDV